MSQRRKFSRAFKVESVRYVHEHKLSLEQASRDLGVDRSALGRWVRQYSESPSLAFPGSGNQSSDAEELRLLRRELSDVIEERDILKKALAIFTKKPK